MKEKDARVATAEELAQLLGNTALNEEDLDFSSLLPIDDQEKLLFGEKLPEELKKFAPKAPEDRKKFMAALFTVFTMIKRTMEDGGKYSTADQIFERPMEVLRWAAGHEPFVLSIVDKNQLVRTFAMFINFEAMDENYFPGIETQAI